MWCRVYGTPSYEVQNLFSQYQGRRFMRSDVDLKPEGPFHEWTLAASTTCQDAHCHHLALKVCCVYQSLVISPSPHAQGERCHENAAMKAVAVTLLTVMRGRLHRLPGC